MYLPGPQVCVLVHSGCYYNKILLTRCLIGNRSLFFTVVETGSQIRVPVGLGKALPGRRLLIPSHCRRSKGPLRNLFYQVPIPFRRISPPWPSHPPQRPHLLMPSHWGLRFQHGNLGGTYSDRPWQSWIRYEEKSFREIKILRPARSSINRISEPCIIDIL